MSLLYPKTREDWLDLRHKYISSTDSPSLFDVGYQTRLGLYFEKLEERQPEGEISERMEMGLVNQRSIAIYIARKYGIKVKALNCYATRPSRMGSSFDYEIIGEDLNVKEVDDDSLRLMYRDRGPGILEIKNVDVFIFRDEWQKLGNGSYEAPPHIEIQVQHQLRCIGRSWSCLGVCVGGNRLELMIRLAQDDIGEAIEARTAIFWDWVEKKTPPPEKMPEDFELLKKLFGHAEPGKVFDATGQPDINRLARVYAEARAGEKRHKAQAEIAHAEILKVIGDASKVVGDSYTISCGVVARDGYTVEPSRYRMFRLNQKKPKVPAPGEAEKDAKGAVEPEGATSDAQL